VTPSEPDIDEILARPENRGCSRFGADMGRRSQIQGEPERLHLQALKMVDGDYDTGAAYWDSDGTSIWCAFSPVDAEPIRVFVRATGREQAKALILEQLPGDGWSFFEPTVLRFEDMGKMEKQYVVTAIWSTNDESTPEGGEPFDQNYTPADIDLESLAEMNADCQKFKAAVLEDGEFCSQAAIKIAAGGSTVEQWLDTASVGHDFWLTKCGHGCGFWDGDYEWIYDGAGDQLTKIAKKFGESNLYLGDDRKIYLS
jgi:hypothetical protein